MGLAEAVKGGRRRRGQVRLLFDDGVRVALNDALERAAKTSELADDDPEREAVAVAVEAASQAFDEAMDVVVVEALRPDDYAQLLADHMPESGEASREQNRAFADALIRGCVVEDELPVSVEQLMDVLADGQRDDLYQAALAVNRAGDTVGKSAAVSAMTRALRRKSDTQRSTASDGQSGESGQKTTKPTRSPGSKR